MGPKQIKPGWFSRGIIFLFLRFWRRKEAEIRNAIKKKPSGD